MKELFLQFYRLRNKEKTREFIKPYSTKESKKVVRVSESYFLPSPMIPSPLNLKSASALFTNKISALLTLKSPLKEILMFYLLFS